MDFGLSDEQRQLADILDGYLADQLPVDTLRTIADQGTGFNDELWQGLVELGLPGLLIPEAQGGSGLGILDAAVVAESLGYGAAPAPYVASMVMAPLALLRSGDDAQQANWLPRIAAGNVRVGLGFEALSGSTSASDLSLVDGKLTGEIGGFLDGGAATHVLLYLADGRAVIADANAEGVALVSATTIDGTRPLTTVTLTDASVEVLDATNDPLEAATSVLDAGRVMLAADTLGAGQRMLDNATEYAGDRVQFDRPIASFQAVKHMCADVVSALEPCRALVWYAAYAQDAVQGEARVAACHAKAHLAEVGRDIARTTTEVHGGMGFTDLMGLHYWFKRIGFDRQVLGGPEQCRHEAAVVQGWAAV
jgi:alkylation response protein AidB-like acyl-CoA dehydrogenase